MARPSSAVVVESERECEEDEVREAVSARGSRYEGVREPPYEVQKVL